MKLNYYKKFKKGDIVVNPWVPKYYNGELNPLYATIYIGDKFIDFDGRVFKWDVSSTGQKREWAVIGNVDIKNMIEEFCKKED
jgi:hypothetical protein